MGRGFSTRMFAFAAAIAALLALPAAASSAVPYTPSSEYPSSLLPQGNDAGPASGTAPATGRSGGAGYSPAIGDQARRKAARRKRRDVPVLASFQVSRTSVFAYGKPATITYQVNDRSRYVRVRLAFVREGGTGALYRFDLGRKRTGVPHSYRWRGIAGSRLATQGSYHFRINVRDPDGNRLVRSSESVGGTPLEFRSHRFPVNGAHNLGGPDARFGASRPGHVHQGQDILAAEGTPVVAPRAGIISYRAYQAEGAGYYLALAAEGEAYNYVFMHLERGSILVNRGDHVTTGQQLGNVGATGAVSAPHLHFEIWDGPWYAGGKPIDPLPMLQIWDSYS
jgi:murein DD-endopeptidase MepM/ murein hydrolase activator NlpD